MILIQSPVQPNGIQYMMPPHYQSQTYQTQTYQPYQPHSTYQQTPSNVANQYRSQMYYPQNRSTYDHTYNQPQPPTNSMRNLRGNNFLPTNNLASQPYQTVSQGFSSSYRAQTSPNNQIQVSHISHVNTATNTRQSPFNSIPINVTGTPSKKELTMFVSESERFSVVYPNWWSKVEPCKGQIMFISPRDSPSQFCENISVIVEDLATSPMDLRDYTQSIMRQLTSDSAIVIASSTTEYLSGLKGQEVVFTETRNGNPIKFKQMWTIYNRKCFIVTFTCSANKFEASLPLVNQLMHSLRILPSKALSNSVSPNLSIYETLSINSESFL